VPESPLSTLRRLKQSLQCGLVEVCLARRYHSGKIWYGIYVNLKDGFDDIIFKNQLSDEE
jgi:hypothetical protein